MPRPKKTPEAQRQGATLKAIRRERGYRQVDVAARIGMASGTYSQYEAGYVPLKTAMIRELAPALDIPPAELAQRLDLTGEGELAGPDIGLLQRALNVIEDLKRALEVRAQVGTGASVTLDVHRRACPSCDQPAGAGANYCQQCGVRLPWSEGLRAGLPTTAHC